MVTLFVETREPYGYITSVVDTGNIVYPLLKFAKFVKSDSTLEANYGLKANEYIEASKLALRFHDGEWTDDVSHGGAYRALPQTLERDTGACSVARPPAYPYNIQAIMGRALLLLGVLDDDREARFKAQGIATYIRNALNVQELNGRKSYWWKYQEWTADGSNASVTHCNGDATNEDYSHGADVADFIRLATTENLEFTHQDLALLANTFTDVLVKNGELYRSLKVGDAANLISLNNQANETPDAYRAAAKWLVLAPYGDGVIDAFNSLNGLQGLNLSGPNDSTFKYLAQVYSEHKFKYGTYCKFDNECESGICYASGVCANLLSTGSICYRDNECSSDLCVETYCVAPGSVMEGDSCNRDKECSNVSSTSLVCSLDDKMCSHPATNDGLCKRDEECATGFVCANETCKPIEALSEGDSCYRTLQCESSFKCLVSGGSFPGTCN